MLKYGILVAVLTSFWAWFFNAQYLGNGVKSDNLITAVKIANPEEPQYESSKQVLTNTEPTQSDFSIEQEQSDAQSQYYSELNGDDNDYIHIEKEEENEDEATIEIEPTETHSEQKKEEPITGENENDNENQIELSEGDHNDSNDDKEEQDKKEEHIIKSNDDDDVTDNQNETLPQMTIENAEEEEEEEEKSKESNIEESDVSPETVIIEENKEEEPSIQNAKTDEEENKTPQNIDINEEEEKVSEEIKETEKTEETVIIDNTNSKEPQNIDEFNKQPDDNIQPQEDAIQPTENDTKYDEDSFEKPDGGIENSERLDVGFLRDVDPQKFYVVSTSIFAMIVLSILIDFILHKIFQRSPWKKCPSHIKKSKSYIINPDNLNAVTKSEDGPCSTVIGGTPLPIDSVSSWGVKILQYRDKGRAIYVGVAPYDIDQNNKNNYKECGWYYNCSTSSLWSGPPHGYGWPNMRSGPSKGFNEHFNEGDVIGVKMDPVERELSFTLDGVSYCTAYENMPLDKPLVPCVILESKGDSVEIIPEKGCDTPVERYIDPPENFIVEGVSWDFIAISWFPVIGADSYQVEVDKNGEPYTLKTTEFRGNFLPATRHTFRVRALCGNASGAWSSLLRVSTKEAPDFSYCAWREMPEGLDSNRMYYLDPGNFCNATKIGSNGWTFVIGNAPIPLGHISEWCIYIDRNKENSTVLIGVSPFDVDPTFEVPYKCGWYLNCFDYTLWSGPPHDFNIVRYGLEWDSNAHHEKEMVGVIMDTKKGNLSFIMNGINLGVAYDGIPLDKPLVPSVILYSDKDSVELAHYKIEEKKNYFNAYNPNPYVKGSTWSSLTVGVKKHYVKDKYQVEIDGTVLQAVDNETITLKNLTPSTGYNIRVRTIDVNGIGEWSEYLYAVTDEKPNIVFSWKKCPDDVNEHKRYKLDPRNPSIAICENFDCLHVLLSDSVIPLRTLTSWRIRICNSRSGSCAGMFIGVSPQDANQNSRNSLFGWYIDCYNTNLRSGPPHNYNNYRYGPEIDKETCLGIGSAVDVTMDTGNGELSFSLNGRDYGTAYDAIPLDKPLVPSVLLYYEGDSVELTFLDSIPYYGEELDLESTETVMKGDYTNEYTLYDRF